MLKLYTWIFCLSWIEYFIQNKFIKKLNTYKMTKIRAVLRKLLNDPFIADVFRDDLIQRVWSCPTSNRRSEIMLQKKPNFKN